MTVNPRAQGLFEEHFAEYAEQYHAEILPRWLETKDQIPGVIPEPIRPDDLRIMWDDASINDCESPIEQMMLAAMMFCSTGYGPWPVPIWNNGMPFPPSPDRMFVSPQFKFGDYRIDIAVFGQDFGKNEFRFAIECDGHNFHKTKEQMKRDRKRDRFLQLWGWHIIRFTGSEIYADADACAEEVGNLACQIFDDDLEARGHIAGFNRQTKLAELGYVSPFRMREPA